MKKLINAANWKSNMTKFEAKGWLENFSLLDHPSESETVLFAPFTLLDMLSSYIRINDVLPVNLGAQDISPFDKGAFTGEINADQIKEFGNFVLIGHSERRSNFNESNDLINKKIEKALSAGLRVIVCVSNLEQVKALNSSEIIIAYEPLSAIGTGNAENPEDVKSFVDNIKEIKNVKVIYGGSVKAENVNQYTSLENIEGVLVGSASLDANSFSSLIKNAF